MSVSAPIAPASADGYQSATSLGQILIDALGPWMTLYLAWYMDAIGAVGESIFSLVNDQGVDDGIQPTVGTYDANGVLVAPGDGYQAGYASAFDPQQATAGYGFLGQFVGVTIPPGTDNDTAKSLVLSEQGMSRGTNAAMIAAAKRFLTGSQSVTLLERTYIDGTPTAGWFLMVVDPSQVTDTAGLIAAVNAVKMGGLQWTLIEQASWTWAEAQHNWSQDTMTWNASATMRP